MTPPSEMKATAAGYMRISDVNAKAQLSGSHVQNVSIGKNYKIKQLKTMGTTLRIHSSQTWELSEFLEEMPFAQSVVTFDSRSKIMVINYLIVPKVKGYRRIPLLDETEHHSIVNVRLGNNDLKVLFDTGAGGFSTLFYGRLQQAG